jgi:hypothetical protein
LEVARIFRMGYFLFPILFGGEVDAKRTERGKSIFDGPLSALRAPLPQIKWGRGKKEKYV